MLLLAGALGRAALGLALPVLPLTVDAATHNGATTGLVTRAMAAFTIALELLSPGLLHRFRARPLLVAAMLLQLVAMAGFAELRTLPAMLACGAVTGAGQAAGQEDGAGAASVEQPCAAQASCASGSPLSALR